MLDVENNFDRYVKLLPIQARRGQPIYGHKLQIWQNPTTCFYDSDERDGQIAFHTMPGINKY